MVLFQLRHLSLLCSVMLTPDSIEKIKQVARIEEVVGDFVTLKRRGSNMIGRCPFHDEKTPSFTVNTARGIFKCFGCGKAGDSIKFVMEHEHFSYPEALKFIARRYNLEVEEREVTNEERAAENERESLFAVNEFARNFFRTTLLESDEGQTVGLSYFKERGFSAETIEKFQLGYSPESFDAILKAAEEKGYKAEYLIKLGLVKENDKGRRYDAYRGRVIFPIHNISGRVIGFGGRVLKKTETAPKYINSPQNEIYDKSKTLYGIYFAKEGIIKNDMCYLVEGYTDVTSLYQAGIKNVVASSGTSLTNDQIKLIRRFSENVTILYDGDNAGIKASFRGIDMILEQGLNVRVLLFPEGEDPDSFAKKTPEDQLLDYLKNNTRDFISFKTEVLVKDAGTDPVKRAEIIREVVTSISLVPDPIKRSVFIRECATLFAMEENMLNAELNKLIRNKQRKQAGVQPEEPIGTEPETVLMPQPVEEHKGGELEEKDLITLLIKSGRKEVSMTFKNENGDPEVFQSTVADFIIGELREEAFVFDNPVYNEIFVIIEKANLEADEHTSFEDLLIRQGSEQIQQTVIDLISSKYTLSERWVELDENIKLEHGNYYHATLKTLNKLKLARVGIFLRDKINSLKETAVAENMDAILEEIAIWNEIQRQINNVEGMVINKR